MGIRPPVVAGKLVFVTCEPGWKADWPLLVCLDADTGKELWRRELNHLPVSRLSADQRFEAAKAWHEFLDGWARGYRAMALWRGGDDAAKAEANKQLASAGFRPRGGKPGDPYKGQEINIDEARWKPVIEKFKAAGMMGETFREGGALGTSCLGHAFATPISDGERVWAVTAFGGVFCFDKKGELKWAQHVPGQAGEYCRNGRSPLLWKNLLITDITALCRAFDKDTGELKWSAPVGGQAIITPAIITVGGTDVLLCDGVGMKQASPGRAKAFRLPDGQELTVDGWSDLGATALVKLDERDVVFVSEGGDHAPWSGFRGEGHKNSPAAARFRLEGDKLIGTALWNGVDDQAITTYEGMVYHAGKLYVGNVILEALTGKLIAGAPGKGKLRVVPNTRHMLVVAGDKIYGLREQEDKAAKTKYGQLEVHSVDGAKRGQGVLWPAEPTGEKAQQVAQTAGQSNWGYSYSCPFTVSGNRIYARSNDELICIGEK